MFWNPATITQHPGFQTEQNLSLVWAHSSVDVFQANRPSYVATGSGAFAPALTTPPVVPSGSVSLGTTGSGNLGTPTLIPAGYTTLQLNDTLFLGLGINAPFGLKSNANPAWSGRFHSIDSEIETYNFNPVIAYRFSDFASVAAGLQVEYAKARLSFSSLVPAATTAAGVITAESLSRFRGQDINVGFTAGLTVKPTASTDLGVGFRSKVSHRLDGDASTSLAGYLGSASADVTMPEIATGSIRQWLNPQWALTGTVEWTNWSRIQDVILLVDNPSVAATTLPLRWRDGWLFSGGTEYLVSQTLSLRAGAGYEISPVRDESRTPGIPDNDRVWLSAGLTYKPTPQLALELGYSHLFVKDGSINLIDNGLASAVLNPEGTRGTLVARAHGDIDLFSVAVRYSFSAPAPTIARAAEPLVTKD
jgi:long-chain fatty acid transport protein